MFYLPNSDNDEVKRISELIIRWGGILLSQADARSFQIVPSLESRKGGFGTDEFYCGPVYNSVWIEESIMQGRLLSKDEF